MALNAEVKKMAIRGRTKMAALIAALATLPLLGVGSCTISPGGQVGFTFGGTGYCNDCGLEIWVEDDYYYDDYYYDEYVIYEDYWWDW